MPVTAAIMAPQVILGAIQAYKGFQGLKKLENQPAPQYTVGNELRGAYDTAQGMSQRGYTGGEQASYLQNLQQANNTQYQNARNMAGSSLGGAIGAGIQSQNIGALNQFAQSDAELHRRNVAQAAQLAGDVQQQQNLNTQANIQDRLMRQQAFGGAAQQGLSNIAGGLSQGTALVQGQNQNNIYRNMLQGNVNPAD